MITNSPPTLHIAPMMRYSHRHARTLWRMLCPDALLYTEMIHAAALVRGRADTHLHDPVVLQLAGNCPQELAAAARRGAQLGYTQLNLNCGCPSARVASSSFGAIQMASAGHTAKLVAAMRAACTLPISVKCRTAINELNPEHCLLPFAAAMHEAGCTMIVVHVRKAILGGLSTRQNRTVPPLEPHWAPELKRRIPALQVISNGGITSLREAQTRADGVDGVMLGRAIVARPALLTEFNTAWFQRKPVVLRSVASAYLGYCAQQIKAGAALRPLLIPLGGLVAGQQQARSFRRLLHDALGSGDLAPLHAHWQ